MDDFTKTNKYKTVKKGYRSDKSMQLIFAYIELLEAQIQTLDEKLRETENGSEVK